MEAPNINLTNIPVCIMATEAGPEICRAYQMNPPTNKGEEKNKLQVLAKNHSFSSYNKQFKKQWLL